MPIVKFHIDLEADVENRYTALNNKSYGMDRSKAIPSHILNKIEGKPERDQKEKIKNHIQTLYTENSLAELIISHEQRRNKNGEKLRNTMQAFIGKVFPSKIIDVYITTINRCPYNPQKRSCMYCPFRDGKLIFDERNTINTLLHETLHMMVHYYYEDYIKSKGLSNNEFHDLKEAQTTILNIEYKDILTRPDTGYTSHKSLRRKLEIFRTNNRNFEQFIEYGIKVIKEGNYLDS